MALIHIPSPKRLSSWGVPLPHLQLPVSDIGTIAFLPPLLFLRDVKAPHNARRDSRSQVLSHVGSNRGA